MICEIVRLPDGMVAFVKMARRKPKPCSICKEPSSRLCDFVVDRTHSAVGTCDKPLCTRCAVSVGRNVDHCPDHPAVAGAQMALEL